MENPIRPTANRPNLRNRAYWTADFTQTWSGMCYTLNVEESEGNNELHLFLNVGRILFLILKYCCHLYAIVIVGGL